MLCYFTQIQKYIRSISKILTSFISLKPPYSNFNYLFNIFTYCYKFCKVKTRSNALENLHECNFCEYKALSSIKYIYLGLYGRFESQFLI